MRNYDGKNGTQEEMSNKDNLLNDLFVNSDTPDLSDTDEILEVPSLSIDLDEVDKRTEERAKVITERLSDYYFVLKQAYQISKCYLPNIFPLLFYVIYNEI